MRLSTLVAKHQSLAFETELLEACDWDEGLLNRVITEFDEYIKFLNPDFFNSFIEARNDIAHHIEQSFNKKISDIIIKAVDSQAKHFKQEKNI